MAELAEWVSETLGGATGAIDGHRRSVVVTTLASLGGVAAGVASAAFVGTTAEAATEPVALAPAGIAAALVYLVLALVGVDVDDFGTKDTLYLLFMVLSLWFVSYGVLLSSGATL